MRSVEIPQSLCALFIALARERGGADNITCMILRMVGASPAS